MGRGLFQPMHLLVILFIVLLIFGPGKLPAIGKGLGESIRGFKKAMAGDDEDDKKEAPKELASPSAMAKQQEPASKETADAKKDSAT